MRSRCDKDNLSLAIFYDHAAMVIGTVKEHVDSYCKYSKHIIVPMDLRGATQTAVDLDKFDALIFHYSVVISSPNFISANFAKRIREFTGTKILFIQDKLLNL